MASSQSLPALIAKHGILSRCMSGVLSVLQKELALSKPVRYTQDERIKDSMSKDENTQYPYAWVVPSDAQAVRDGVNARAVARYGQRTGNFGATRNTTRVARVFPVNLGLELHYVTGDPMAMLAAVEMFLIFSATTNLNFDLKFGRDFFLNTRIEIPDSASIPLADTSDTTKPGGGELTLNLIVHTYAGFFTDVSSVYNKDPVVGYYDKREDSGPLLSEDSTSFREYEPQLPKMFTR